MFGFGSNRVWKKKCQTYIGIDDGEAVLKKKYTQYEKDKMVVNKLKMSNNTKNAIK